MVFYLLSITYLATVLSQSSCDKEWQNMVNYDVEADRTYYIGCVEEKWSYAPSGKNLLTGEAITDGSHAATWLLANRKDRIGPEYIKALYREFTDPCFTQQKKRTKREQHLGALGPNIRAISGERIKVFYKNTCSFPTSIHTHGLKYDKTSEGAPYDDNSNGGDIVSANGGKWIYIYDARTVKSKLSSKMWLYHSHVDEMRDVSTGLIGAIIVTKKGFETSQTDLMPRDIHREFVTFMVLYDENDSMLSDINLKRYLNDPASVDVTDDDFVESNLMHAINGYLFGNLDSLNCVMGDKVRWYTASFGNEGDGPHSPHWHGNIAVDANGESTDTVALIPGTTYTVTMLIDQPGTWLYHCHVHDHIEAGMVTIYTADPKPSNNGICSRKAQTGPCKAKLIRFYYDINSKKCETFIYGGCKGNKNNFKTLTACQNKCVESPIHIVPNDFDWKGALKQLQMKKALWQSNGITKYLYHLDKYCFCLPCDVAGKYIEIKGGVATDVQFDIDATNAGCDEHDIYTPIEDEYLSISSYFDIAIQHTIKGMNAQCIDDADNGKYAAAICGGSTQIEYDNVLHYPTKISLNLGPRIADGGITYNINCLSVIHVNVQNQIVSNYNNECESISTTTTTTTTSTTTQPTSDNLYDIINCGDSLNGFITVGNINYYLFNAPDNNGDGYSVLFDSCGSSYDTKLYWYDMNFNIITECDDCGSCGINEQLIVYVDPVNIGGAYYLGIGGFTSQSGQYFIKATCNLHEAGCSKQVGDECTVHHECCDSFCIDAEAGKQCYLGS